MVLSDFRKDFERQKNPKRAKALAKYFKTGKGEYGEGDIFAGLTVPKCRELSKKYSDLDLKDLGELISSKTHEERLIALLILVSKYKTTNHQKIIFHFYLKNIKYINNWDLVDLSAPNIVGEHLRNNTDIRIKLSGRNFRASPFEILETLAHSKNIWERRIAVLSTFAFIQKNEFDHSLKIARILISDREDLIQKAVGWMIREIGKRNMDEELKFLKKYYKQMGRTTLRYSIEKLPESLRLKYLKGKI